MLMADTPHADRRAARVPISSAVRRMSSSSARFGLMFSLFWKRSSVSERFSKGSLGELASHIKEHRQVSRTEAYSSIDDRKDESRE